MQNHNSNRRNFNLFKGKPFSEADANPKDDSNDKKYIGSQNSYPNSKQKSSYFEDNGYGYVKFKTSALETDKNSTIQERFMYVVLTAAIVIAIICTILSIASMIMFFTL